MAEGKRKYGLTNWREQPVTFSTYYDAAQRHLMSHLDGEDFDPDSGIRHLGLAMACMAILIDASLQGTLNDDRTSQPGPAPAFIVDNTKRT